MRLRCELPAIDGDHAGRRVERGERRFAALRAVERVVAEDEQRPAGRAAQLGAQPGELRRARASPREPPPRSTVSSTSARTRAGVEGVVERGAAGSGAQRRRRALAAGQPRDQLGRAQWRRARVGGDARGCARARRRRAARRRPARCRLASRGAQVGVEPATIRVPVATRVDPRRSAASRPARAGRGCRARGTRARSARASGTARCARAEQAGVARRVEVGAVEERVGVLARLHAVVAAARPCRGRRRPPSSTASAWSSSFAAAESTMSPVTTTASGSSAVDRAHGRREHLRAERLLRAERRGERRRRGGRGTARGRATPRRARACR